MVQKYQRSVIIEEPRGSTGNAELWGEAANALGGLNKFFFGKASEAREREGQEDAARAAEATGGKPRILENPQSIYQRSYQKAALNSYAQSQQLDIDSNLSRFAHEANGDPLAFNEVATKYVEGLMKNTPLALKEGTRLYAQQQIMRSREALTAKQLEREREANRATLNASIRRTDDRIARYVYDNDFEAAEQERTRRDAMLLAAVETGVLTEAEMLTHMDESDQREEQMILVGGVDSAFESGRGSDYVISFMSEPPPGMSPERRDEIGKAMQARLSYLINAVDGDLAAEEDGRKALWRESDRRGTELLIAGELTYDWIQQRLAAGAIDPADARMLEEKMLERRQGVPVSDPLLLAAYETALALRSEEDILSEDMLSWEDKRRLLLERQEQIENGPSFYSSQTYDDAVRRIEESFGLKPGVFLSSQRTDALREASNAVSAYTDELIAIAEKEGMVPASVQMELAQKYIGRAQTSTRLSNLQGERNSIILRRQNGEIDEEVAQQALAEIDAEIAEIQREMQQ